MIFFNILLPIHIMKAKVMELYSVIKNDGPADVLFWKFTGEDFRNGSQLIVAENEVALFVKDGVILETFEGGRYNLETNKQRNAICVPLYDYSSKCVIV